MAYKSDEFFRLDEPYDEIFYQDNFWVIVYHFDDVADLLYWPDKIESPKPPSKWIIKGKEFRNVSFKETHISFIEFTDCHFKNCLFLGSTITDCRFNNCHFESCNFFRAQIQNCFIDPSSFDKCIDATKYPNVGYSLYQELLHNSRQQVQPEFTRKAQYNFARWQRYFHRSEIAASTDSKAKKVISHISLIPAWLFEKTTGSGVRISNLTITSFSLLLVLTTLNYYFSSTFGLMLENEPVCSFSEAFYFSTIVVTSLGFGDITPTNNIGRVVVAFEAMLGFLTFATLVSMAFRRISN